MNSLQRTSSSFAYVAVAWFSYSNKELSNKASRVFARSILGIDIEVRHNAIGNVEPAQTMMYRMWCAASIHIFKKDNSIR